MSDAFLSDMTTEEYNDYHIGLFGKKWKDVKYEGHLEPTLLDKLRLWFKKLRGKLG